MAGAVGRHLWREGGRDAVRVSPEFGKQDWRGEEPCPEGLCSREAAGRSLCQELRRPAHEEQLRERVGRFLSQPRGGRS